LVTMNGSVTCSSWSSSLSRQPRFFQEHPDEDDLFLVISEDERPLPILLRCPMNWPSANVFSDSAGTMVVALGSGAPATPGGVPDECVQRLRDGFNAQERELGRVAEQWHRGTVQKLVEAQPLRLVHQQKAKHSRCVQFGLCATPGTFSPTPRSGQMRSALSAAIQHVRSL
jgi:hypothetical protein